MGRIECWMLLAVVAAGCSQNGGGEGDADSEQVSEFDEGADPAPDDGAEGIEDVEDLDLDVEEEAPAPSEPPALLALIFKVSDRTYAFHGEGVDPEGHGLEYLWEFTETDSSGDADAEFTFPEDEPYYIVSLTGRDAITGEDSRAAVSVWFYLDELLEGSVIPMALIGYAPLFVRPLQYPGMFDFYADYEWLLDSGLERSTEDLPQFLISEPGRHTLSVTATSGTSTAPSFATLYVCSGTPVDYPPSIQFVQGTFRDPGFSHENITTDGGNSLVFSSDFDGGAIANVEWDIEGDGYNDPDMDGYWFGGIAFNPGTGNVLMKVRTTDDEGNVSEASMTLHENAGGSNTGIVIWTPNLHHTPPAEVKFYQIIHPMFMGTVRWDFGDGETYEGDEPVHRYANPGSYPVRAAAVDIGGNEVSSASMTIVVADCI